jgi:hypothetical protein
MVDGKFVDIWDYPGGDLITLCEKCHAQEEANLEFHKKNLYFAMREYCDDADTIVLLVRSFKELKENIQRRINIDDINDIKGFIERHIKKKPVIIEGESMSDALARHMREMSS